MPSSAWKKDVYSRSEEHTSELQSLTNLVCRLLLVKTEQYSTSGLQGLRGTRQGGQNNLPVPVPSQWGPPPRDKRGFFFFKERGPPEIFPFPPPPRLNG